MAKVSVTFRNVASWTAPAGVTQVEVSAVSAPQGFVANGNNHVAMLGVDGKVYAWGQNTSGQLGDNTVVSKSSPVPVVGLASVLRGPSNLECKNISSMGVIGSDGRIYCWGENTAGAIGDGTTVNRSSPVLIANSSLYFNQLLVAYSADFALTVNGDVYSWGSNFSGSAGDGTTIDRSSPVRVLGQNRFVKLATTAGANTVLALTEAGSLFAWGTNDVGQLGTNSAVAAVSSPVQVVGGNTFVDIYGGIRGFFGTTTSGDLYAWGPNTSGCLGVGDTTNRSSPTLVLGGKKWASVVQNKNISSFSQIVTFGITTSGELYSWGFNGAGVLGIGVSTGARSSPTLVAGSLRWQKVFCECVNNGSNSTAAALTTSGDLYAWGDNSFGQLGVGDTVNRSTPTLVLGGYKFVDFLISNGNTIYAQTSDGKTYAWGDNNSGKLGDNTATSAKSSPVLVQSPVPFKVVSGLNKRTLSVIPGATYRVSTGGPTVTFGTEVIAAGPANTVTVTYNQ